MSSRRVLPLSDLAAVRASQLEAPRDAEERAWSMPESGEWSSDAERDRSLEHQLLGNRWLVSAYSLMLLLVGVCRFVIHIETGVLCIFCACFALPLLAGVTLDCLDKLARAYDRAHLMVEDPQDPDVCPVVLTIYRDGRVSGEDAGVAWFEDDILAYSGNLCSFVIGRRDVSPEDPWRVASRTGLLPELEQMLFLRSEGPALAVRLLPAYEQAAWQEKGTRFLKLKREFRHGSGGPAKSFYPPTTVSPRLTRHALTFRHLIWLQSLAFIYFAILSMLAGVPAVSGLIVSAVAALAIPLLRPRRDRDIVAATT